MAKFSDTPATVAEFRALRDVAGLGAFAEEATRVSLEKTHFAAWMRDEAEQLVAMGRVIGDGVRVSHVTDVAVHPDLQGLGLGTQIMTALSDWMERHLPKRCYVSLIADPRAERLYQKFGFEARHGMARTIK